MNNERILLIDDVGSMRGVIKSFLRDAKYQEIDEAVDGAHGYDLLKRRKYALVICDFEMPKLNGLELLKRIRSEKKMRHVQFIMVTARNDKDNIKAAMEAGVNDYVRKPFQARQLTPKVERCLTQRSENILKEQQSREAESSDYVVEIEVED